VEGDILIEKVSAYKTGSRGTFHEGQNRTRNKLFFTFKVNLFFIFYFFMRSVTHM